MNQIPRTTTSFRFRPPLGAARWLALSSVLGLAFAGLPAHAAVTTVNASLDTYVKENRPFSSFSTEPLMEVRAAWSFGTGFGRFSFVRFDVPALSAPFSNVRLRVKALADIPTVGAFFLPNASFDGTIAWAGIDPHIAGNVFLADAGPAVPGGWLEWDVTGFVQPSGAVYFGLANQDLDLAGLDLATTEAGPGNAPQLIITHPGSGTPVLTLSRNPAVDPWYRPGYSSLGNLGQKRYSTAARRTDITLKNTGTGDLNFSPQQATLAAIQGSGGIVLVSGSLPVRLQPNQTATVSLELRPVAGSQIGRHQANLQIPTVELGTITTSIFAELTQGRDCDPGPMKIDLANVLGGAEATSVGCWNDGWSNFNWTGSYNIPLITNAVRLHALGEPAMATFFQRYVDAAVFGAVGGPGQPPSNFQNLLLRELGSTNYDTVSVVGVLAARAWAKQHVDQDLKVSTGAWLRAYFTLAGLSATPVSTTATPISVYVDEASPPAPALPLTSGGTPSNFRGPAVMLTGQRSCPEDWSFTDRPRMVARALDLGGNAIQAVNIDTILGLLEGQWSGAPAVDGNLYGLTATEGTGLRNAVNGISCPSNAQISDAFAGIRTQPRVDLAGWRNAPGWGNVRASSATEVSGPPTLFGAVYVPAARRTASGREVHVLFPHGDPPYPACSSLALVSGDETMILSGDRRIEFSPNAEKSVTVDLPDQAEWFHLAIGPNGLLDWSCTP